MIWSNAIFLRTAQCYQPSIGFHKKFGLRIAYNSQYTLCAKRKPSFLWKLILKTALPESAKRKDCWKCFIVNLHERMLPDLVGIEPVTACHQFEVQSTEPQRMFFCFFFIYICLSNSLPIWLFCCPPWGLQFSHITRSLSSIITRLNLFFFPFSC